jgi:hypothetical protein
MTTEHQTTREEKAYGRLLEEKEDMLSEAALTILSEAQSAAYAECMVHNYCFQPEEYDEAMEKMSLAAAKLTDSEYQLLAKIWRAALVAAASVDADDYESVPIGSPGLVGVTNSLTKPFIVRLCSPRLAPSTVEIL